MAEPKALTEGRSQLLVVTVTIIGGSLRLSGLLLLGVPHGEGPSRGEDAPLPLGAPEVQGHLEKTFSSYCDFLAGLEEVVRDAPPGDPRVQTATLLLRLCGQGKATHLLRTLPPALTKEFAEKLDKATEDTLENLCRLDALTPTQREQLRLPLRRGRLGLRSQASLRGVAYLGSWGTLNCCAGAPSGGPF